MNITLADQSLELLSDRAVFWPDRRALLVADVHLGKDAVFRQQGLAVPAGVVSADLDRLSRLIEHHRAEQLIILGDWVHAPPQAGHTWPHAITQWRNRHAATRIDLVLGNHDRQLEPWLQRWHITGHHDSLMLGGLLLVHEWQTGRSSPGLSGHLHPGARLRNRREQILLPAFLLGGDHLVVPAFGRFTGVMEPAPFPATRRFVVAGSRVIEVAG